MGGATLDDARAVLSDVFRYPAFRQGQSAAVFSVLRAKDTVVILPTGGGKSLCYQVPALLLPGLTIVVSPLISLMQDQVGALRRKGVAAAFINSSIPAEESAEQLRRAERGELTLLYVSPERFEVRGLTERLRASRLSLLAVDEAHCISQWGHDFRPSYRRLALVRRELGSPPAIALTATATPAVRNDIIAQLRLRSPTVIVTGFDRPNLVYSVRRAKTDAIKTPLIHEAVVAAGGPSIVYASTKRAVDRVSTSLRAAGIRADAYHAGLDPDRRKKAQEAFLAGEVHTIVATNAFGMGIDKPDVRLVVHHSMPGNLEGYYQEAGRAGRDGKQSRVLLLHSYADRYTHEFFIGSAYPPRKKVEAAYKALQRMTQRDGLLAGDACLVAGARLAGLSPREMQQSVRILQSEGILEVVPPAASPVRVRLLATPDRIASELGAAAPAELEFLRALWRVTGSTLLSGAEVDLSALGPAISVRGCIDLLDALQRRQFVHWTRVGGGIRLVGPAGALTAFRVDWKGLDARRSGELQKLEAMQSYAFTHSCRRAFFLRYFGEAPRKTRCATCDNCTGRTL